MLKSRRLDAAGLLDRMIIQFVFGTFAALNVSYNWRFAIYAITYGFSWICTVSYILSGAYIFMD